MQLSYSVRNLFTMLINECVIIKLIPIICIRYENYENVKAVVMCMNNFPVDGQAETERSKEYCKHINKCSIT